VPLALDVRAVGDLKFPQLAQKRAMSRDEFVLFWRSAPSAVTNQQTRQTECFRRQRVVTLG
jgi:hypothetical protein